MSVSSPTNSGEQTLHAALELRKNNWLLTIQSPDRDDPSLHPIRGGDAEGWIARRDASGQRLAKAAGQISKVTLCYEAGYGGFRMAAESAAVKWVTIKDHWYYCRVRNGEF